MKIEVTQEDISNGINRSGQYCPIALALKKVYKCDIDVGYNSTYIQDLGFVTNSQRVKNFIMDFDYGRKCNPIIFECNGYNLY